MEVITAPKKEIIWFDAAHEIPWECTEEYQQVIIERIVLELNELKE